MSRLPYAFSSHSWHKHSQTSKDVLQWTCAPVQALVFLRNRVSRKASIFFRIFSQKSRDPEGFRNYELTDDQVKSSLAFNLFIFNTWWPPPLRPAHGIIARYRVQVTLVYRFHSFNHILLTESELTKAGLAIPSYTILVTSWVTTGQNRTRMSPSNASTSVLNKKRLWNHFCSKACNEAFIIPVL